VSGLPLFLDSAGLDRSVDDAMVILGGGFGTERLAGAAWLAATARRSVWNRS
jgi:hypothetical protein